MAKWSSREKQFFYLQLKTLLEAKIGLARAVELIAKHRPEPALSELAQAMRGSLAEGKTMAEFMRAHGEVFSRYEADLMAVGEEQGRLAEVLDWLAELFVGEGERDSRSRLERYYLVPLGAVALMVLIFSSVILVPSLATMFDDMGRELPWLTQQVIALNRLLLWWGLPLLAVVIALGWILPRVSGRYRIAASLILSHAPWAGASWIEAEALRFALKLGRGLEAGLAPQPALADAAEFVAHPYLKDRLQAMGPSLKEGGSLAGAFKRIGRFPKALIAFAELGERQGDLGPALIEAARSASPRRRAATAEILSILFIVGLAIFIAMLAVSMYLPIFMMAG